MKKIIILLTVAFIATVSFAQAPKDVTQFLGIPVDGFKPEMIKKLKDKGYRISPSDKDVLIGEFNGIDVLIHVATNNNKVCRIMVSDVNSVSEVDIKIRFNKLCQQFQNNEKYMSLSDYTISDDENISYGLSVENKRYEAVFYQKPMVVDSVAITEEVQSILLSKYTEEQLANPTEELQKEMTATMASYISEKLFKKTVWFMINELYGKYYITMFYDNEYNRANGEDL